MTSIGPERTRALGRRLGALIETDLAIFLDGDLGSGKTCLTQGIAVGLGVPEDTAITSPTYALMNHYSGRRELFHFDLYRLSHPEELADVDFEEVIGSPGVTVVEWASQLLAPDRAGLHIALAYAGEEQRVLTFMARGPAAQALLGSMAEAWAENQEGS